MRHTCTTSHRSTHGAVLVALPSVIPSMRACTFPVMGAVLSCGVEAGHHATRPCKAIGVAGLKSTLALKVLPDSNINDTFDLLARTQHKNNNPVRLLPSLHLLTCTVRCLCRACAPFSTLISSVLVVVKVQRVYLNVCVRECRLPLTRRATESTLARPAQCATNDDCTCLVHDNKRRGGQVVVAVFFLAGLTVSVSKLLLSIDNTREHYDNLSI